MTRSILCAVLIVLAVLGCYANSLSNELVWDDQWLIVQNSLLKDFHNLPILFRSHLGSAAPGESNNFYRPLQEASYMLDHFLWGLDPFGYHLTNVLLHCLISVLVFLIGMIILNNRPAALIAGLLFAVHPVNTEAVTYVAGRADLLMTFFLCVSFLCFVIYTRSRSHVYKIASLAAFFAAVLSKEAALIYPLILAVYLIARSGQAKARPKLIVSETAMYLGVAALYVLARLTILDFSQGLPGSDIARASVFLRLITSAKVFLGYIGLLICPLNLHMERSLQIPLSISPGALVIAFLVSAGIITACYYTYRRKPGYCFLIAWFLIGLFPVSNVLPLNATMAEHWLYFPEIGLFLLAGQVTMFILPKVKMPLKALMAAFLGALIIWYGYLTVLRNPDWRDERSIFENTLHYDPSAYKVWNNFGTYYNRKNEYAKAAECFKRSIQLNDSYYLPYENLCYSLWRIGNVDEAINMLETYTRKYPDELSAWLRLGNLYERKGDVLKAKDVYQKALIKYPGNDLVEDRLSKLSSAK